MRVLTLTGTDTAAVDKEVSDWLAEFRVHVRHTSTAFRPLRDKGKDAITGKTVTRRAVAIAISFGTMSRSTTPSDQIRSPGFSAATVQNDTLPIIEPTSVIGQTQTW
jgi:hypothetical protein